MTSHLSSDAPEKAQMLDWRKALVTLSMHDRSTVDGIVAGEWRDEASSTDPRTRELARIGALCAAGGSAASYADGVQRALDAGVTPGEIVGTLFDIGPLIGSARLVSAAMRLAPALDVDVESQLESLDDL